MERKDEVVNGNMANSMEELKQLGKQMENMRDGQQLEDDDRVADPKQFDDEK
ncbi:MAG: multidrug ABC transporter ATPase [Solibacillus sp.]